MSHQEYVGHDIPAVKSQQARMSGNASIVNGGVACRTDGRN
jgi:hypothetical protein